MTKIEKGKFYSNKGKVVFVATVDNSHCPRINVNSKNKAKLRDDYSKGFKISKHLTRNIFR